MTQITQRSFTSGELAPALRARADLSRYSSGLSLAKNFIVKSQGGIYSRPGTRFIGELDDSSKVGRLIEFSFNTEQTYMLVFEHNKMRVIKDGGFVLAGAGPSIYELVTTYTEAELPRLQFTQSADVLTIVHPDHDPANLGRVADDNWTLTAINYASTVTAPTSVVSANVGAGAGGTYNKTYVYVVTAVDADGVESLASSSTTITRTSMDSVSGVRVSWAAVTGADYYRVYKDPSNLTQIYGWIGDTKTLTFDDYNVAPLTSDAPPEDRQPFSSTDDKPSTVEYYQQRQAFANTTNEPQTVFLTQTADFSSMRTSNPTRADDAITFTIAARQVNEIRHIVSLDSMMLLTSGGEWKVTEGQDGVLTPSTVGVRLQSSNGASWVRPVIVNSTALYVQAQGTRVRDLGYEFSQDKFTGNDLSLLSDHLFEGRTVVDMAFAEEPYGILWCVMSDGALLGLTYQREHKVWGWHQHETDGYFESVSVISEEGRDAPYFIVKRTIDGNTVRYVERMEPRFDGDPEDCFCVDSGLSYDGSPVTTVSGLDHLEGEDVAVLADGNEVADLTVASGQITVPTAASKIHVGLPYVPAFETLDLDVASLQQTIRGRKKAISKVIIEVEKTRGGYIGLLKDDGTVLEEAMMEIPPRFESDGYDTMALKTFKQFVNVRSDWTYGGRVRVEQRAPLPLAVLAIIPEVDLSGDDD